MHIESTGYISIEKDSIDIINELINKHQLSNLDCHESEVMTDVSLEFVNELTEKGILTSAEQAKLLGECDVVKFYT